jgi:hypothetical protein
MYNSVQILDSIKDNREIVEKWYNRVSWNVVQQNSSLGSFPAVNHFLFSHVFLQASNSVSTWSLSNLFCQLTSNANDKCNKQ